MKPPSSPISHPMERREDGPWWVRVTLWVLVKYGLPTVAAIGLSALFVYLAVGDVAAIRANVAGTRQDVSGARADLQQHNTQMTADAATTREQLEKLIRINQAMCYNAARSDAARNACAGGK